MKTSFILLLKSLNISNYFNFLIQLIFLIINLISIFINIYFLIFQENILIFKIKNVEKFSFDFISFTSLLLAYLEK